MLATALQNAFYREHQGVDFLSRNFESHYLHSCQDPDRITISQDNFDRYLSDTTRPTKVPWGRSLSYGGFGPVQLPKEYRPKQEPPTRVQKGHSHFGGGMLPFPSGFPIDQYYDLTALKKSNLRRNDELKIQIPLRFPAEHPYTSHMAKFQMFPSFESPEDIWKGKGAVAIQPTLPATAPASAPDPTVFEKAKGHSKRKELVTVQHESRRKPLTWPEHNLLQMVKGPDLQRQHFYPSPPTSVLPNTPYRSGSMVVSPRTANALYNVQRSYWQTQYQQQFSGNGPQNILKLDNFEEVLKGEGSSLKEHFKNEFGPPRPLEGRLTEVRRRPKKKKKVVVGHGTELWMTDSEDEEENDKEMSIKKTHGNCFTRGELLDLTSGPKFSQGYPQHNLTKPDGEYTDVHAFALAHPHLYYSSITSHVNSKDFAAARPATAPVPPKRPPPPNLVPGAFPSEIGEGPNFKGKSPGNEFAPSPIVNNMPSQISEQPKTGSTQNHLYPKWFRSIKLGETRPSTALLNLQNGWSKTEAHRRFHEQFPENAPDIRRKPDLRITTNERRHVIPETGTHVYYFHR